MRLKDMDRMGIDIQAVCPAPNHFFYFTEADYGCRTRAKVNEGIAKIVADTPDRFVGLGSVPLQNADRGRAANSITQVKNLGLGAASRSTPTSTARTPHRSRGWGWRSSSRRCEELGIVIFMHPLGYTQGGPAQRTTTSAT